MADPFEVRVRFTNLLTHLSASQTSSMKTAAFALKHRDMDEDLHSCILECLESGTISMNSRANIMYFLEHFCDMAVKEKHEAYVDMVRRDIAKIVDAVVGRTGGSGVSVSGANIKVARKVVGDLGSKGFLEDETVRTIDQELKVKEEERSKQLTADERTDKDKEMEDISGVRGVVDILHSDSNKATPKLGSKDHTSNGVSKMDKRAIEQRIEEDRERNKRQRETVWAVGPTDDEELAKLWEETSDLNEDDYVLAREEAEERAQFARYHRNLLEDKR